MSLQRKRLEDFTRSLGIALFDRKLELQGVRFVYYYDADVVLQMIQGFERKWPEQEDRQLVLSLLACHFLGRISVLRPHALEIDSTLRNLWRPRRPSDLKSFQEKAQKFLKEKGITKDLEILHEIVADENLLPEQKVEKFLELFRGIGVSAFVAIEQISGIWMQRWKRFSRQGLLDFDHLGPEMEELFRDHRSLVFEIFDILQKFRPGDRQQNLRDSAALAIIHQQLRKSAVDSLVPMPRFYTNTERLRSACFENERLRELLGSSGQVLNDKPPRDFSISIRDSSYFVMRARFAELSAHQANHVDIDALSETYRKLVELLDVSRSSGVGAGVGGGLDLIDFKGQPIPEIIEEFEQLSLMTSIWHGRKLPEELVASLPEWTDVFRFAQRDETGNRLLVEIDDLHQELGRKLEFAHRWTLDYGMLYRATKDRKEKIRGELEDPMRDLGLVRWGYSLMDDAKADLIRVVKDLLESSDDRRLMEKCSRLASRVELARSSIDQCLIMTAVLWALGKLDEVVDLVEHVEHGAGRAVPPSLVLIHAAAKIRSDTALSLDEKRVLIDRVWQLREGLAPEALGGYLLGLGYVLYRAWRSEMLDAQIRLIGETAREVPPEVVNWASRSFDAGRQAFKFFEEMDLAWAFAINHCAYVGLVTGRNQEEIRPFFRTLRNLTNVSAVWNSRFDDTLGCFYLVSMEREWDSVPELERWKLDFGNRMARAEKHFKNAERHDFGDIDLDEHVERLESLKTEWAALRDKKGIKF